MLVLWVASRCDKVLGRRGGIVKTAKHEAGGKRGTTEPQNHKIPCLLPEIELKRVAEAYDDRSFWSYRVVGGGVLPVCCGPDASSINELGGGRLLSSTLRLSREKIDDTSIKALARTCDDI